MWWIINTKGRPKKPGQAIQSCLETFLLSSENDSKNVWLITPKTHYGTIFQPAIPKTWQECFYFALSVHKLSAHIGVQAGHRLMWHKRLEAGQIKGPLGQKKGKILDKSTTTILLRPTILIRSKFCSFSKNLFFLHWLVMPCKAFNRGRGRQIGSSCTYFMKATIDLKPEKTLHSWTHRNIIQLTQ